MQFFRYNILVSRINFKDERLPRFAFTIQAHDFDVAERVGKAIAEIVYPSSDHVTEVEVGIIGES